MLPSLFQIAYMIERFVVNCEKVSCTHVILIVLFAYVSTCRKQTTLRSNFIWTLRMHVYQRADKQYSLNIIGSMSASVKPENTTSYSTRLKKRIRIRKGSMIVACSSPPTCFIRTLNNKSIYAIIHTYIVFKSNSVARNNLAYEMKLSMLVFKECLRHMMRKKWGRHLYMY